AGPLRIRLRPRGREARGRRRGRPARSGGSRRQESGKTSGGLGRGTALLPLKARRLRAGLQQQPPASAGRGLPARAFSQPSPSAATPVLVGNPVAASRLARRD